VPEAAPVGRFVIQLAALRSEPAAARTWRRFQKSFPALLGDSTLLLQRVDLAHQGTFYRIRTGPFPSRDRAEALCLRLKSKQQDCMVIAD
jgi:cell division septation protein DedD